MPIYKYDDTRGIGFNERYRIYLVPVTRYEMSVDGKPIDEEITPSTPTYIAVPNPILIAMVEGEVYASLDNIDVKDGNTPPRGYICLTMTEFTEAVCAIAKIKDQTQLLTTTMEVYQDIYKRQHEM